MLGHSFGGHSLDNSCDVMPSVLGGSLWGGGGSLEPQKRLPHGAPPPRDVVFPHLTCVAYCVCVCVGFLPQNRDMPSLVLCVLFLGKKMLLLLIEKVPFRSGPHDIWLMFSLSIYHFCFSVWLVLFGCCLVRLSERQNLGCISLVCHPVIEQAPTVIPSSSGP